MDGQGMGSPSRSGATTKQTIGAVGGAAVFFVMLFFLVPADVSGSTILTGGPVLAIALLAAMACFLAGRRAQGSARKGWLLISLGMLTTVAGSLLLVSETEGGELTGLSIGDPVMLVSLPLWLVGFMRLFDWHGLKSEKFQLVDLGIIGLSVSVLIYTYAVGAPHYMARSSGAALLGSVYLIGGVALVFIVAASGVWSRRGSDAWLLLAATIALVVGSALHLEELVGGTNRVDAGVYMVWAGFPLLITVTALRGVTLAHSSTKAEVWRPALILPVIATAVVVGQAVMSYARGWLDWALVAMTVGVLGLVVLRLVVTAQQSERRRRVADHLAIEQQSLMDAAKAVTSTLDFDTTIERVMRAFANLLGPLAEIGYMEIRGDGSQLVRQTYGDSVSAQGMKGPADQGLSGMVIERGGPVILDRDEVLRRHNGAKSVVATWFKSDQVMGVPVRWRGEIRGVLAAGVPAGRAKLGASEVRLAEALAELAGVALGNAKKLQEEQDRRRESEHRQSVADRLAVQHESLVTAAKAVTSTLDLDAVIERVLNEFSNLVGPLSEVGFIEVRSDGWSRVRQAYGETQRATGLVIPPGEGMAGAVAKRGETVILDHADWMRTFSSSRTKAAMPESAQIIGVPVRTRGRLRAVLVAGIPESHAGFDASEVQAAEALAELAGVAISNAEVLRDEHERRRESERRLRERAAFVDAARSISGSLDVGEVTKRLVENVRDLIGAEFVCVSPVDVGLGGSAASRGSFEHENTEGDRMSYAGWLSRTRREEIVGAVLARDDTEVIARVEDGKSSLPADVTAGQDRYDVVVGTPVRWQGQVRGVLIAHFPGHDEAVDPSEVRLLEAFADMAAVAMGNAETINEVRKRAAESKALRLAAADIAGQRGVDEIMSRLARSARDLIGADASYVAYMDEQGRARWREATGLIGERWRGHITPPGIGITAQVMATNRPVAIEGIGKRPESPAEEYPGLAREGLTYVLGAPIRSGGKVVASLIVGFRKPHRFAEEEIKLLEGLAQHGGLAMDAARLIEEHDRSNEELRSRLRATIQALATAIAAQDGYTSDHSRRVVELAAEVGKRMGLTKERIIEVRAVAELHDVGKIGVPNELLNKPAALNDAEWEVMRQHPIVGAHILEGVPGLEEIAAAVRHEHEYFDGTGYPDQLEGDSIPLASRIVLVCDAYHAMTSNRPYRKALKPMDALAELARYSGTQFDPAVVQALFMEMQEQESSLVPLSRWRKQLSEAAEQADSVEAREGWSGRSARRPRGV